MMVNWHDATLSRSPTNDVLGPPVGTSPLRVVIVDDHELVRHGLRAFLESDGDITVVGEASSGEAALTLVHELQPDVVVMDVRLPGMGGVAATQAIRRATPGSQVLALSSAIDSASITSMIRAGAVNYLPKTTSVRDLCRAVHVVATGQTPLSPEIAMMLIQELRTPALPEPLTARELDILRLLSTGLANKAMARALSIQETTVKTHVSTIMAKLGVQSRTQAVMMALSRNLISLGDTALAG
jgi:two-component system, NarL family, response regulator LiaR